MHPAAAQPHAQPPSHQRSHQHAGTNAQAQLSTPSGPKSKLYHPRHPAQTRLYRTVAEHFECLDRTRQHRPIRRPGYPSSMAYDVGGRSFTTRGDVANTSVGPDSMIAPRRSRLQAAGSKSARTTGSASHVCVCSCVIRGAVWRDSVRVIEPDLDLAAQPAPDFDVDQRVNW